METVFNIFAPVIMLVSSVFGSPVSTIGAEVQSVELGLYETSPRGPEGGFAIPASGCSASDPEWHGRPIHDCDILPDITTNKSIIRLGDPVTVSWDPKVHQNCVLSNNVMVLSPAPDGDVAGSRVDYPTGETSYSIVCEGIGNEDSVTVRVLPRIQET